MCGFAVSVGAAGTELVAEMIARLEHRGPDGRGVQCVGQATLGHVRLAIVDVAGGAVTY